LNHLAGTLAVEEPIFSISVEPGVVDTQMQVNIREQRKYKGHRYRFQQLTSTRQGGYD
jgi:hypothetical protein